MVKSAKNMAKLLCAFTFIGAFITTNNTSIVEAADTTRPFVWGDYITPEDKTGGSVTIYINGGDTESGIGKITLPDGSSTIQPNAKYTVSQNGYYTFRLEDKAGNVYNHTVQITNIDKTAPTIEYLTLQKNINNTYQVSTKVSDESGINTVKLNTGQLLSIPDGEDFYFIEGLTTKPSNIEIRDKLGNTTGLVNFNAMATHNYNFQASNSDVVISLNGSGQLTYKIDYKSYPCPAKPCQINIDKDSKITTINTVGNKTSIDMFMVSNINKKSTNFVLKGSRNTTDSTKLSFSWNKTITNGTLTCETPEGTKTYTATGAGLNITGKNFQYDCIVGGLFSGTSVTSNWVSIFADFDDVVVFTKTTNSMPIRTFSAKVNVFVEKNSLGDFYIINTSARNSDDNRVPIASAIAN